MSGQAEPEDEGLWRWDTVYRYNGRAESKPTWYMRMMCRFHSEGTNHIAKLMLTPYRYIMKTECVHRYDIGDETKKNIQCTTKNCPHQSGM